MLNRDTLVAIGVAALLYGAGLLTGWWLCEPAPVVEQPAPAVEQGDGSVVLEKKPLAPGKKPTPPHDVPRGSTPTAGVSVTVQPDAPPALKPEAAGKACPQARDFICPPVTIDLTVVREKDRQTRVVASSPDGTVLAGVHVPFENVAPTKQKPWTAGAIYTAGEEWGAFVQRDVGPVAVGLMSVPGAVPVAATIGLRF